jgi:hypothetical protein
MPLFTPSPMSFIKNQAAIQGYSCVEIRIDLGRQHSPEQLLGEMQDLAQRLVDKAWTLEVKSIQIEHPEDAA